MPATPIYGIPYAGLLDSPHGPNQQEALAEAVETELVRVDADIASVENLLKGYAAPTQTGSGLLTTGGNGAVIMEVAIADPGFSYHIIASGSLGWAMSAASIAGRLIEVSTTINSTVYNTNRIAAGFGVSHSLGAGFSQPTVHVPLKRSDAFGAQVGAKTVRLIARNSSSPSANMDLPASSLETSLTVRIVPA